jgi:hypothetical protein
MRNAPYIIKSSQNNTVGVGPTRVAQRHDILKKQQATSMRQCSEWGMRALQGTFSRLKARLGSNKKKRGKIIHSIILLHNFRTYYVGLNQIATVFNPHYEQYVNLENYDRIRNYFL